MNDDRISYKQFGQLIEGRDRPAAHAIENAARGVNAAEQAIRQTAAMIRAKLGEIEQRLDHGLSVRRRSGFLWRGRGSGAGDADAGVAGGWLAGFGLAAAPCRRGGALRGCIRGRVPARWGGRMWRGPPRCLFGEALGEDRWVDAWRRRAHGKR